MLRIDEISKSFGATTAVDTASLEVRYGEVVALLGPSGSGKTTMLRLVAGFESPDGGTVAIDGRRVAGSGTWVPPERRGVGMVFQDYALFPHLDVADNIGFGVQRGSRGGRVAELLDLTGLQGLGNRFPHELSGGQRQRVALARALAPGPKLVLLDEPWNAVDPLFRASLREEVIRILRGMDVTVLLVTHDREEAFTVADRIAIMRAGKVVQAGQPEYLYFQPADRWCAGFVGASNLVRGVAAEGQVQTPVGTFLSPVATGDVDVLLRPELLELELDDSAPAEVVDRTFLGHDVLYRVRLADGTVLASQRPSNEVVPLGSHVKVHVHEGPVAIFRA